MGFVAYSFRQNQGNHRLCVIAMGCYQKKCVASGEDYQCEAYSIKAVFDYKDRNPVGMVSGYTIVSVMIFLHYGWRNL